MVYNFLYFFIKQSKIMFDSFILKEVRLDNINVITNLKQKAKMGMFSWKTIDTDRSISNSSSRGGALPVTATSSRKRNNSDNGKHEKHKNRESEPTGLFGLFSDALALKRLATLGADLRV